MKIILIILLITCASGGSYYYYHHTYVETLTLSEIVGRSDDNLTNIAVNFLDFDTGLTRNDLKQLKNNKAYWIGRMKEVEVIQDPNLKMQANTKLLSDMMDDPNMKKVCKMFTSLGFGFAINLLER
jgi:hypothetical protein